MIITIHIAIILGEFRFQALLPSKVQLVLLHPATFDKFKACFCTVLLLCKHFAFSDVLLCIKLGFNRRCTFNIVKWWELATWSPNCGYCHCIINKNTYFENVTINQITTSSDFSSVLGWPTYHYPGWQRIHLQWLGGVHSAGSSRQNNRCPEDVDSGTYRSCPE